MILLKGLDEALPPVLPHGLIRFRDPRKHDPVMSLLADIVPHHRPGATVVELRNARPDAAGP